MKNHQARKRFLNILKKLDFLVGTTNICTLIQELFELFERKKKVRKIQTIKKKTLSELRFT